MTAIIRSGGEYDVGTFSGTGHIEADVTGTGKSLVSPGRTGGRCYRATRVNPSEVTFVLAPDYGVDPAHSVIARGYFRLNQYPDHDDADFGISIMTLGGSSAFVRNDGKLRWTAVSGSGQGNDLTDTPDVDDPLPIDEWFMIELVSTYNAIGVKQRHGLRLTLEDGTQRMVYWRACSDGTLTPPAEYFPSLSFGILGGEAGAGFVIDCDDLGINVADSGPHATWLGPGEVRVALPASYTADDVFEQGKHANTARAVEGRTIPSDDVTVSDSPEICSPQNDFAVILARDPADAGSTSPARCIQGDKLVNSAGTDYHKEEDGPGSPTGHWTYDYPRVGAAGDSLVLTLDASDQSGDVSYVMPFGMMRDDSDDEDPHYFSFYGAWEAAPTYGDDTDDATIRIQSLSDIDHEGMRGRLAQSPTLATSPTLTVERQHACSAADSTFPVWEWSMAAIGAMYESGYEPQPELPECRQQMTWT